MSDCKHLDFHATVTVNRLEDTGSFMAEVRIECRQCHLPFQFLGLPIGLHLRGATMNVDGQEARLAIAPVGSIPQPPDGVLAFGIRPHGAKLDS